MRSRGFYSCALWMKVLVPVGGSLVLVALELFRRSTSPTDGLSTDSSIRALLFMAVAGYLLGSALFLLYRSTVLRSQVRRRGLVCVGCNYPLRTLPPAGQCPECGRQYVRTQVAQAWRELLGGRSRHPERAGKAQQPSPRTD